MSLNEILPTIKPQRSHKHRRTQSSSEQDIQVLAGSGNPQSDTNISVFPQVAKQSNKEKFPSSNETQEILKQIQENPEPMICIIEPIESNVLKNNFYGSMFNFGKGLHSSKVQQVEPNSSTNPYELNLKDSNLFQIPELNDLGTITPSVNKVEKHQKQNSLTLPKDMVSLSVQLQSRIKQLQQSPGKVRLNQSDQQEPKSQQKVRTGQIFSNKKPSNNFEFLQKQLKSYLHQRKQSSVRTMSNYDEDSHKKKQMQNTSCFTLSKSDEGILTHHRKPSKIEKDLIARIRQLEVEVLLIKMKNVEIESLNKQLISELKTSHRIQQDYLKKTLDIENRVTSLEYVINRVSTRVHTSDVVNNLLKYDNYINRISTDNSLDFQLDLLK